MKKNVENVQTAVESKYHKFKQKFRFTSTQIIVLGYLVVILLGSFLLSLPIASKARVWTPYITSLFTATSATCVTGLIVVDTYTYWSLFGQLVILGLIQIGGIGFMTIITLVAMFMKRQIGLFERTILMRAAGTVRFSGVILLIKRIIVGTAIFEGVGTLFLLIRFVPIMGFWNGLYNAIFHSISAFCNAGFDLMGKYGAFSSLTAFSNDVVVNLTIMALIFVGGLGFLVWSDIWDKRGDIRQTSLHTRVAFITTVVLIVLPTLITFALERNRAFATMNWGEALLASAFQTVSYRTAGFNTVDLTSMSEGSYLMAVVLMLIGGSPGSTAGGIKTTTIVVMLLGVYVTVRNKEDIEIGKRRLDNKLVRQANAIVAFYFILSLSAVYAISLVEKGLNMHSIVFEVVSALGTVGMTLGITTKLSVFSKFVLIILMFMGRLGALTLLTAFMEKRENPPLKRPVEKILIG